MLSRSSTASVWYGGVRKKFASRNDPIAARHPGQAADDGDDDDREQVQQQDAAQRQVAADREQGAGQSGQGERGEQQSQSAALRGEAPAQSGQRATVRRRRQRSRTHSGTRDGLVGRVRVGVPGGRVAGDGPVRGAELPGNAGDHHPGSEQQPGFEPQGALVVQQVLPPVADDVLGDEHGDHVARAGPADLADVVEDGPGDVAVRGSRARRASTGMSRSAHSSCSASGVLGGCLRRSARPGCWAGWRGRRRGPEASAHAARARERRRGPGWGGSDPGRSWAQLDGDPVVVAVDGPHQDEQRRHRDDHDVGAVGELREQHDDQDQGGEDRAERR